ncbi:MAG TPA: endolytic transglycosylase MltG [Stellaceae bacterium]|nr:endolytic transglycosylase MltG [Stellaceae bacterium]
MRLVRLLIAGLVAALIVVAILAGAGYWLYRDAQAPGPLTEATIVVVPSHIGVAGIADLLTRHGVIRRPLAFDLAARMSGRGAALKAGEYEFPAAASVMQTLNILASGKTVKHRLTIPEGLTSAAVVALVRNAPALDGDVGPVPSDGTLLPDTYVYSYGDTRKALIERMQRAMTQVVAQMWKERRPDLLLATPQEAVILASIIEKETAREEERAHVAGVFINRLRLGMRLQADPTVIYALSRDGAKIDRPLNHADLATNSPYNTYLVKGLPPGPITNPSRSSLRAAMRPEPTEDLYFVADGSGGHVFAKTLADQTRNIAEHRHGMATEPDAAPAAAPQSPTATAPRAVAPAATAARHRRRLHQQAARLARCRHAAGHACRR